MSIGIPTSVKNINYLGTQTNQPTLFYSTTASGISINDPLGLTSAGAFAKSGSATDITINYASTGQTLISGTKLTLSLNRTAQVFVSFNASLGNLGAGSTDNTSMTLFDFFNGAFTFLGGVLNPGCYTGGANIGVTGAFSNIVTLTSGTHTLALYLRDTGSSSLAYCLTGSALSYIVLGS